MAKTYKFNHICKSQMKEAKDLMAKHNKIILQKESMLVNSRPYCH